MTVRLSSQPTTLAKLDKSTPTAVRAACACVCMSMCVCVCVCVCMCCACACACACRMPCACVCVCACGMWHVHVHRCIYVRVPVCMFLGFCCRLFSLDIYQSFCSLTRVFPRVLLCYSTKLQRPHKRHAQRQTGLEDMAVHSGCRVRAHAGGERQTCA